MNWWPLVAGAAGIILAVLAYLAMKRAHERAAVAETRAGAAEKGNEDAREAIKISEANRRLSDDELRRKL